MSAKYMPFPNMYPVCQKFMKIIFTNNSCIFLFQKTKKKLTQKNCSKTSHFSIKIFSFFHQNLRCIALDLPTIFQHITGYLATPLHIWMKRNFKIVLSFYHWGLWRCYSQALWENSCKVGGSRTVPKQLPVVQVLKRSIAICLILSLNLKYLKISQTLFGDENGWYRYTNQGCVLQKNIQLVSKFLKAHF